MIEKSLLGQEKPYLSYYLILYLSFGLVQCDLNNITGYHSIYVWYFAKKRTLYIVRAVE